MNIIKWAVKGGKKIARKTIAKAPIMVTGAAIVGVFGVAVAAAKAGPKLKNDKEDLDVELKTIQDCEEQGTISNEEAKKRKKEAIVTFIKKAGKTLLPVIISAVCTIGCILGINSVHAKKQAALAAASTLIDKEFDTFVEKAKEVVGEDKINEIEEKIFKDQLAKDTSEDLWSPNQDPDRMEVKAGKYPMHLGIVNYYISGDKETAEKLEYWIENRMLKCGEVSIADLCDEVDAPHQQGSEYIGWTDEEKVSIRVVRGETPQGHLCYKMRFNPEPHTI